MTQHKYNALSHVHECAACGAFNVHESALAAMVDQGHPMAPDMDIHACRACGGRLYTQSATAPSLQFTELREMEASVKAFVWGMAPTVRLKHQGWAFGEYPPATAARLMQEE